MNITKTLLVFSVLGICFFISCSEEMETIDLPPKVEILNKIEIQEETILVGDKLRFDFVVIKGSKDIDYLSVGFINQNSSNPSQSFENMLNTGAVKLNGETMTSSQQSVDDAADTLSFTLELAISERMEETLFVSCTDISEQRSSDRVDFKAIQTTITYLCGQENQDVLHSKDTVFANVQFDSPRHKVKKMTLYQNEEVFKGTVLLNGLSVENPISLDVQRGSFEIAMIPQTGPGQQVYHVVIEDEEGNKFADFGCRLMTNDLRQLEALLYADRYTSSQGFFCLDLETGRVSKAITSNIHIVDNGLDTNANDSVIWKRSIRPVNNVELAIVTEAITYDEVQTVAEIKRLFDTGIKISSETGTGRILGGELFALKNENRYYIMIAFPPVDQGSGNHPRQFIPFRWKKERAR